MEKSPLTKKLPCNVIYVVPIGIFCLVCVYMSSPINPTTLQEKFLGDIFDSIAPREDHHVNEPPRSCDYSKGKWIPSELEHLYNDTSCTVREGQNCISNGRPDSGYLYWRWKPSGDECELPRFDPEVFFELMKNKHLAFVGDSLARNQMESLTCMLSSLHKPTLLYSRGTIVHSRWVRWNFPSHNLNVSLYWSPFLVNGTVSGEGAGYNMIYLDTGDETWTCDLSLIDVLVLSAGYWFPISSVYFEGGSEVGCHFCPNPNHTEMDTGVAFGKAFKTAFKVIIDERRKAGVDKDIGVIVTTYSGDHFQDGAWYGGGRCPKTEPYEESSMVESRFEEIRKVELEAVEEARSVVTNMGMEGKVRIAALDVTKLSWLRPDAHPGPYMHHFPFGNQTNLAIGEQSDQVKRVPQDCLHWCLPGAIDTWNEIMLQIMKGWRIRSS